MCITIGYNHNTNFLFLPYLVILLSSQWIKTWICFKLEMKITWSEYNYRIMNGLQKLLKDFIWFTQIFLNKNFWLLPPRQTLLLVFFFFGNSYSDISYKGFLPKLQLSKHKGRPWNFLQVIYKTVIYH